MNTYDVLISKATWSNKALKAIGLTELNLPKTNNPVLDVLFDASVVYAGIDVGILHKIVDLPKTSMSVTDIRALMKKIWRDLSVKDKYYYDLFVSLNEQLGDRTSIGRNQWKTLVYKTILEAIPLE